MHRQHRHRYRVVVKTMLRARYLLFLFHVSFSVAVLSLVFQWFFGFMRFFPAFMCIALDWCG